jgi:hypothetical protein
MYKLCFFVPESHLQQVKHEVFKVGAGRIGSYDCCCWQVKGVGQFRALEGSNPYLGEQKVLEVVEEFKVEMVCENHLVKVVIEALKDAHPYETPAYEVYQLEAI